jgi:16S rRNA (cytidine1402-2'-O)-methyltransferase
MHNLGTLYVVATPIGNMGDITYRAVETLKNVNHIYAEDTREFSKIAKKYEINVKTHPYNAHSSLRTHNQIIETLNNREDIALVSDAGTPGISDPGSLIVNHIINNYPEIKIVPIPGASAVISAVSVSGIFGNQFSFLGFIPNKKGRETFLKNLLNIENPVVFYESCHRVKSLLEWFSTNSPTTKIMVARELTKMFETIRTTTAHEHLNFIKENPKELKGEFTLIIYPK